MPLTDDDIQQFGAIWRDEFGEVLSVDELRQYASALLELYLVLAGLSRDATNEPLGERTHGQRR